MAPYDILLDEGPGYLFLKLLGQGGEGQATAVRDAQDGTIYVRKRLFPQPPDKLVDGLPAEVWAARRLGRHDLVPFVHETSVP